jgi:hypothetical protein
LTSVVARRGAVVRRDGAVLRRACALRRHGREITLSRFLETGDVIWLTSVIVRCGMGISVRGETHNLIRLTSVDEGH